MLDSNLATCTRLQLIIGCLQVFWKSLTDEQKARLDAADRELLDRICAKRASQIIYALDEATKNAWLEDFGGLLLRLHQRYSAQSSPRYRLIERLLLEQYQVDGEETEPCVVPKPAKEISADSLQSPQAMKRPPTVRRGTRPCVVTVPT